MDTSYEYCPKCGVRYLSQTSQNLTCSSCKYIFYQNSKPTASTLIINEDNEVLLGKRSIDPSKGKWDVIGGFLNLGESPEAGALREAKEEAGVDVQVEKFIGIFMDTYGDTGYSTLNICYTAKIIGGKLKAGDDIDELKWFSASELPAEIAYDNGKEMLSAWRATLSAYSVN